MIGSVTYIVFVFVFAYEKSVCRFVSVIVFVFVFPHEFVIVCGNFNQISNITAVDQWLQWRVK